MSFGLLSTSAVLLGLAILAAFLWVLQRLRVQHREVEVQTTLFWQAALEETRARVFVKRFRHWPAWLLLVAIASLLWMLLAQPQRSARGGTQHIVLLDWSVADPDVRRDDLAVAMKRAASLPPSSREIIAVSTRLETLLAQGEPLDLAGLRADLPVDVAPFGLDWALESIASRSSQQNPVSVYVVGDGEIDQRRFEALSGSPGLAVSRLSRSSESSENAVQLKTFGASDSRNGIWEAVDVWLEFARRPDGSEIDPEQVVIHSNGEPVSQKLLVTDIGRLELLNVPTDGSTLDVLVDGATIGSLTLPNRSRIKVLLQGDVPAVLRELVELDPACELVADDADIVLGTDEATADLFLSPSNANAAFAIWHDDVTDSEAALAGIVDELALRQIDATGLAKQARQQIQVDLRAGQKRHIAIWRDLFTAAFDFQESRACPVVISRSLRWLANQPSVVEWAAIGERLPSQAPRFARVGSETATTSDGRKLAATRLAMVTEKSAALPTVDSSMSSFAFSPLVVIGVLCVVLLTIEWILYQRGHMP